MTLVNALTDLVSAEGAGQFAADLGVYIGALAMIVTAAFGIAELVGLVDRFLVERSIRRAFIARRRTPTAKVISIRQRRAVFGQREIERRKS